MVMVCTVDTVSLAAAVERIAGLADSAGTLELASTEGGGEGHGAADAAAEACTDSEQRGAQCGDCQEQ